MTRPLTWTVSLATGIKSIDAQHQELFERANRFLVALAQPPTADVARDSLAYLLRYVQFHFAEEEQHMARLFYPDAEAHRGEHRTFLNRLAAVHNQFESEGDSPAVRLSVDEMLRGYLLDHIGNVDRRFGEYARSRGAS
jgi:hemerythrin-like metal-binding protein